MSTLTTFAQQHRVKVTRGDDDEPAIPGAAGCVYAFRPGRLAVQVTLDSPRAWSYWRAQCLAAGMTLHQDGATEGALLFDPSSAEQAQAAIVAARIKQRKQATPAQMAALSAGRSKIEHKQRSLPDGRIAVSGCSPEAVR